MFGNKEIKVSIDPMGNPKIEAVGFAGQGCEAATKSIEDALKAGDGKMERVLKPEFAATDTTQQQHVRSW